MRTQKEIEEFARRAGEALLDTGSCTSRNEAIYDTLGWVLDSGGAEPELDQ